MEHGIAALGMADVDAVRSRTQHLGQSIAFVGLCESDELLHSPRIVLDRLPGRVGIDDAEL